MKKHARLQPGNEVAYLSAGNEKAGLPPLFLLHGLSEDHAVWAEVVLALAPYGRIYSLDLPGFGGSSLPPEPRMTWYAQAIRSVAEAERISRLVVAGHSLGGYAALQFAAEHGDALAGLVLVHSHPFPDTPERVQGRLRSIEILRAGHKETFVRQLFGNLFAPAFASAHPEVVERCVQMGLRQSAEGIAAAIQAIMHRQDHSETLRNCAQPVLAVLGDEDSLVPLAPTRQTIEQAPHGEVRVLHGVGHMGMFEAPEMLVEWLREFWLHLAPASGIS